MPRRLGNDLRDRVMSTGERLSLFGYGPRPGGLFSRGGYGDDPRLRSAIPDTPEQLMPNIRYGQPQQDEMTERQRMELQAQLQERNMGLQFQYGLATETAREAMRRQAAQEALVIARENEKRRERLEIEKERRDAERASIEGRLSHQRGKETDAWRHEQTLDRMRYGNELTTENFERTTEVGFLVKQEMMLQDRMRQLGPLSEKLNPAGKKAWQEVKNLLHEADTQFRAGKLTNEERLRARTKALEYIDQQDWKGWIEGPKAGDVITDNGARYLLKEDGGREWQGWDPEALKTPEGVAAISKMNPAIPVKDPDTGLTIGHTVRDGSGQKFVPYKPETGAGVAVSPDGQPMGAIQQAFAGKTADVVKFMNDAAAEAASDKRGWFPTQAATKYIALEKLSAAYPVEWAKEMSPEEIQHVLDQHATSIREGLIAQVNPPQRTGGDGKPIKTPGTAITLPGGFTAHAGQAGEEFLRSIPDATLRKMNETAGWARPLSPDLYRAQEFQRRAVQDAVQQQGQQPVQQPIQRQASPQPVGGSAARPTQQPVQPQEDSGLSLEQAAASAVVFEQMKTGRRNLEMEQGFVDAVGPERAQELYLDAQERIQAEVSRQRAPQAAPQQPSPQQSAPQQSAPQQSAPQQGIVPPGQYRRIDGNMGMAGLDPQAGGWQAAVAAVGARQVPVKSLGGEQLPVLDKPTLRAMQTVNGGLPTFPYYYMDDNGILHLSNSPKQKPERPRSGYDPYTDVGTYY